MFFHKNKTHPLIFIILLIFPLVSFGDIRFSDVTDKYGVKGYNYFGGHGICWVDVNSDGKLDIYVKNVGGIIYDVPNNLFINYGNFFLEEAAARGVEDAYGHGTHGAVFADIDNDEDFDLFSTTSYLRSVSHNHIYRNDGLGFYSDITSGISPPQTTNYATRGVAAADFDGDGDIDLYFSNPLQDVYEYNPYPFPPKKIGNFYINHGDGTFTQRFRGINWTGFVQGVVAMDIDGDGDIDIAEAKWTPASTIYINDGKGRFSDSGKAMGLPQTLMIHENGMTFGDIDNDGDLDYAVIGRQEMTIYENEANFFHFKQKIIVNRSFHVCLGDFDHDGDLDLYVSGGNVYENDGTGIFTKVLSNESGLISSRSILDPRGSALGDFDNDGDLDIYVVDADHYNVLFQNKCNDSNWIQVDIIDHNRAIGGIGTKLDLYTAGHVNEPKYLKGHREVHGEYGYLGQDMPTVHFGAPGGKNYDLKVTFFNGSSKVIENITPGQKIQVTYPRVYAPLNFTGSRNENRALFYRENVIVLEWQENPLNENIQGYRIYEIIGEQRTLLAETSAQTFSYMLRNMDKDKSYQFALTAFDGDNKEGEAAFLTIN